MFPENSISNTIRFDDHVFENLLSELQTSNRVNKQEEKEMLT